MRRDAAFPSVLDAAARLCPVDEASPRNNERSAPPMIGFYFFWPVLALLFLFWLFYTPSRPSY